jgi:hypothetical protein
MTTTTAATAAATQIKVPYHRTPFEERVRRAMAEEEAACSEATTAAGRTEAGVTPQLDDDPFMDGAADEKVAPRGLFLASSPTAALAPSAPAPPPPPYPQRPALVALAAAAIRTRSPSLQHMMRSPANPPPAPHPAAETPASKAALSLVYDQERPVAAVEPSPKPAELVCRERRFAEGAGEPPSPTTPAQHKSHEDDSIHKNGVKKYHPDNSVPLHHTPFSTRVDRVMTRFGW